MLFIIRGTSCSGKDTFIDKYFQRANVLSSDEFSVMLTGKMGSNGQTPAIFDFLFGALEHRLRYGVAYTVLNATNLRVRDCSRAIEAAKGLGVPVTFISIDPPPLNDLIERSMKRGEEGGLQTPAVVLERHYLRYFDNLNNFKKLVKENDHVTFIRIDQDYEVIENEA